MATELDDQVLGFIAVGVSIVTFGCWGVPLKFKRVRDSNVDTVIFQAYSILIVGMSGFAVLAAGDFVFSWWGTLGAVLWIASQVAAMHGIVLAGYAVVAPIIAGTTIICSFLWGVFLFGEHPLSMALSLVAIGILVVGIVVVASTSSPIPDRIATMIGLGHCTAAALADSARGDDAHAGAQPLPTDDDEADVLELVERDRGMPEGPDDDGDDYLDAPSNADLIGDRSRSAKPSMSKAKASVVGISLALFCGLTNGALLVPYSLFRQEVAERELELRTFFPEQGVPVVNDLTYLLSFSIGIFIIGPAWLVAYHVALRRWPDFKVKVVAAPAILSGVLWSVGNAASIYAVKYLGNTVGFPLTQTAMLVAALWSVLYFRDIRGFSIVVVFLGASIVLGGSALLAVFGSDTQEDPWEEVPPV